MAEIILYFGSFNPVHRGHISVAEYVARQWFCDEVWMVVSPQNPLKSNKGIISIDHRINMLDLAINEHNLSAKVKVCDIETKMPLPSYTIDTLRAVTKLYPEHDFSLLIGADIVDQLDKWKEYTELMKMCKILVYPRSGSASTRFRDKTTVLTDAPQWDYSSTQVRESLENKTGKVEQMIDEQVYKYIKNNLLWI